MDARVTEFAAADAQARFAELLARAEAGEEIMIKRDGKSVAKLSPADAPADVPTKAELTLEEKLAMWKDWFAYRKANNIRLGAGETIKDLIQDGRRFE